ncbi:hypothetical protein PUNSTDRAFT_141684 [Punctularia strigosozonata HHB-11173 SS5]|uniref:uncharacterized protein n=1 Tax=Punctularia strigosozonata (strain HHB-11173) TaxID=741275 RepID=UPI00044180A2|nr:uncharacterized protein PUNSTDRAFT_141684 [Punctularia strigosozonata HHB-11173 SS5]EIN11262.1 hypothetical protein PUNSTDRAFT_141684 [Punctularia strigosozonata HHB-11173 SS5]
MFDWSTTRDVAHRQFLYKPAYQYNYGWGFDPSDTFGLYATSTLRDSPFLEQAPEDDFCRSPDHTDTWTSGESDQSWSDMVDALESLPAGRRARPEPPLPEIANRQRQTTPPHSDVLPAVEQEQELSSDAQTLYEFTSTKRVKASHVDLGSDSYAEYHSSSSCSAANIKIAPAKTDAIVVMTAKTSAEPDWSQLDIHTLVRLLLARDGPRAVDNDLIVFMASTARPPSPFAFPQPGNPNPSPPPQSGLRVPLSNARQTAKASSVVTAPASPNTESQSHSKGWIGNAVGTALRWAKTRVSDIVKDGQKENQATSLLPTSQKLDPHKNAQTLQGAPPGAFTTPTSVSASTTPRIPPPPPSTVSGLPKASGPVQLPSKTSLVSKAAPPPPSAAPGPKLTSTAPSAPPASSARAAALPVPDATRAPALIKFVPWPTTSTPTQPTGKDANDGVQFVPIHPISPGVPPSSDPPLDWIVGLDGPPPLNYPSPSAPFTEWERFGRELNPLWALSAAHYVAHLTWTLPERMLLDEIMTRVRGGPAQFSSKLDWEWVATMFNYGNRRAATAEEAAYEEPITFEVQPLVPVPSTDNAPRLDVGPFYEATIRRKPLVPWTRTGRDCAMMVYVEMWWGERRLPSMIYKSVDTEEFFHVWRAVVMTMARINVPILPMLIQPKLQREDLNLHRLTTRLRKARQALSRPLKVPAGTFGDMSYTLDTTAAWFESDKVKKARPHAFLEARDEDPRDLPVHLRNLKIPPPPRPRPSY